MNTNKMVTATFSEIILSVKDVVGSEQLLFNAHPNPFSLSTTIIYIYTWAIWVYIYDLAGTKVANVFAGEQNAGEHTLVWNITNSRTKQLSKLKYPE